MEAICQAYWRPLFAFARRWGLNPPDAEDAVQGFLASVLATGSIRNVRRDNGRFRAWLLAGMKHHLLDESAKAQVLKRGGPNRVWLPLDTMDSDGVCAQAVASSESPDMAFDRAWALTLMSRARARLGEECAVAGKADLFEAVFPSSPEALSEDYGRLAERLGVTETGARSVVHRLRLRWRELIRAEIAETVSSRQALEEELACLKLALRA